MKVGIECPSCGKEFDAPLDHIDDLCDLDSIGVDATCPKCGTELFTVVAVSLGETEEK